MSRDDSSDKLLSQPVAERANDWSGIIWRAAETTRLGTVERVCETLEGIYNCQRLGNPERAIDDLIYIIVSNRTSPTITQRVYDGLQKRYASWDAILNEPIIELQTILAPAGLSIKKSSQIVGALQKIKEDFGRCDLSLLEGKPEAEMHSYLTSLPGVSDKVAKCVMMYTLGVQVLPVDSHVYRVSQRLGWTSKRQANQSHEELEALVSPQYRYAYHVDCIVHGRTICRPKHPRCSECCINEDCQYYRSFR